MSVNDGGQAYRPTGTRTEMGSDIGGASDFGTAERRYKVPGSTGWSIAPRPPRTAAPELLQQDGIDEALVSEFYQAGSDERLTRLRRISTALAVDFELAIVLLSFIARQKTTEVGDLVQQGSPDAVFRAIFDFYDAGLLRREGGAVQLTPMGERVLARFGAK